MIRNVQFDLALGHAWQPWDSTSNDIAEQFASIIKDAQSTSQGGLEELYLRNYFLLGGQNCLVERGAVCPPAIFAPTASYLIDLVACLLSRKKLPTALIEPCFGHTALLLQRHGVEIVCVDESILKSGNAIEQLDHLSFRALFLTIPNNPTGFSPSNALFKSLVSYCAKYEIILVVDFAYRFYLKEPIDYYRILLDSGVNFICIEDIGKTWPMWDLRIGHLLASDEVFPLLRSLQDELFLNVQPVLLAMALRFLHATANRGISASLWDTIERNRAQLQEILSGSILTCATDSPISAEWLIINDPRVSCDQLAAHLLKESLAVLQGTFFYWKNPGTGKRFVRIALLRSEEYFRQACTVLKSRLNEFEHSSFRPSNQVGI